MSIGDQYFTEVKYLDIDSDQNVVLDWNSEDILILTDNGTDIGDAEVLLPPPHVSNTWGECWITNKQASTSVCKIKTGTSFTDSIRRLIAGGDITIPQNKTAYCKYVPQRTFNTMDGEQTESGGWIVVVND